MDHLLFAGHDDARDFIVRKYDDGTTTVSVRPLGGIRWSSETVLAVQPAEPTC